MHKLRKEEDDKVKQRAQRNARKYLKMRKTHYISLFRESKA